MMNVLGVSATVSNSASVSGENTSSVTATIAGIDEEFNFDTKTLVAVYNLMPQKVKKLCVASYKDIAPRLEKNRSKALLMRAYVLLQSRTQMVLILSSVTAVIRL